MDHSSKNANSHGAVLSHEEIVKAIETRDIIISPFDPTSVGAASIDLRLGNEFRYYQPVLKPVKVTEETDFRDYTTKVIVPEGSSYLLLPGQLCLAMTKEKITLSPNLCGLLGTISIIVTNQWVEVFINSHIQRR